MIRANAFGTALAGLRPRASLRCLGLSALIAFAGGCSISGTVKNTVDCIYEPTGEVFRVEEGTTANIFGGDFWVNAKDRNGYVRMITDETADKWKCREVPTRSEAKGDAQ